MFSADLLRDAQALLEACRLRGFHIATAESCTGGLIAGVLTAIPGSSDVVDAGFITYSNEAKSRLIGVPENLLKAHGAVSEEVARAMAEGTLRAYPSATIALSVTGVAGPGGGTELKPVGLVHLAAARQKRPTLHTRLTLGPLTREEIRLASVAAALRLGLAQAMAGEP